ncbi:MAG: hypothetical protein ACFFKA_07640 [Candidatus Thorarchaeota archaeon]
MVVKSIDIIPKKDWTNIRYEKINLEGYNIWQGFNSLEGLLHKKRFEQESFANYEWSIIDLKYKENSQLLYGEDIRGALPDISNLTFDFDDILARSLYHLNKSFDRAKNEEELVQVKIELTKAIFKFGFFVCIFHDSQFHLTSINNIYLKLNQLQRSNINIPLLQNIFKNAIDFRKNNKFSTDFNSLRNNFTFLVLSSSITGKLHKTLSYEQFIIYLEEKFGGLYNIIHFLKKAKNLYYSSEEI